MKIIGISAYYHDSAISIIDEGNIIFAAQEERYSRIKHDPNFPYQSIKQGLKYCSISLNEIDAIVFYEKPFLKFERLLETYVKNFPFGFKSFLKSMPLWSKEKLFQKRNILNSLKQIDPNFSDINKIKFSEHHLSHAASAYYPSPFHEAVVLTLDGVGEWSTTSVYLANDTKLSKVKVINFPDSLGLLYSAFTYFLGFRVNSGEYKLMGLAPYGKPLYKDIIYKEIIKLYDDGSYKLNQKYFNYQIGLEMTSKKFNKLFNQNPRRPEEEITINHMNIAASIQKVTEEVVLKICKNLFDEYKVNNLCLAGGVALNCVVNGKLIEQKNSFKNIWIQPASGDAGGSLGAALAYYYSIENNKRKIKIDLDMMNGSFLGQDYKDEEVEKELIKNNLKFKKLNENTLYDYIAQKMSDGFAFGWFQGRMEFGPRALGNRSIIADPRSDSMQKNLNLKVKFRESFRPFAPAVMEDHLSDWFTCTKNSYMLLVGNVTEKHINKNIEFKVGLNKLYQKRSVIPAVTHVDNSARVQSVNKMENEKFYNLINAFYKLTNVPIIINTSFNVRGEPIVNTINDAINCFKGTNLDGLVCNNYVILKNENPNMKLHDYKSNFNLD